MKGDMEAESAVKELLERYTQAYASKDMEKMMSLFPDDPDLVFIGTGEDEWVQGFEELKKGFKRDFKQADEIDVGFENLSISSSGHVAWASMRMMMNAMVSGEEVILVGRLSIVVEKRDDRWFIVHLHFSLPASGQEEGDSYPVELYF
ncbi:MAG: nuclear transport factor 2 family protein [Methanomicrobiales archaeon]